MPKGKNLGEILCTNLKEGRVKFTTVLDPRGFINAIRVGQTDFMVKYANRSSNRHWFGFSIEDMNSRKYKYVVLIIGKDNIERVYCVPYSTLTTFIRKGKPVWVGQSNYEQYEATIFPNRNYIMKVEHWPHEEFEVQQYQINSIAEYFSQFQNI
jgi:hypothetical protein